MSGTKRKLEDNETNRDLALDILSEIGAIKVCEICGYYTANEKLDSYVYAIATSKYKENMKEEECDYSLFHKCIKDIYEEAGVESIDLHMQEVHFKD